MVSVEEHAAHVRSLVQCEDGRRGDETVPLLSALGRVTAHAIASPYDLPLFRNSQMDGFAVKAADAAEGATLPIVGDIPAQQIEPALLESGTAVRIMTGAVVPSGADTIIPVEDTTVVGEQVTVNRARTAGEYVREPGSDVHRGDELLPAGRTLGSRHLAVLAAAGIDAVEVRTRPTVAVITTGSELIGAGQTPALGQIFDANAVAVATAVIAAGGLVVFTERVTDDTTEMLDALKQARVADVIVTSGGISMGDYEVVREALEPLGARIGTVAMQPGGPQATAVFEGTPVICFPGNPVSTQISFELFLAPLLRQAAGLPAKKTARATLTHSLTSVPGKRQYLRGRTLDGDKPGENDRVATVSGPGSHLVAGLAASDVLIIVPEAVTELQEGDDVEVLPL